MKKVKSKPAMAGWMKVGLNMLAGLVVIIAASYIGMEAYGFIFCIFSPCHSIPETCTFPVSLTCTKHSVTGTDITLVLQNGAGRGMTVHRIAAASSALGTGNLGQGCTTGAITTSLRNGASSNFTLSTGDVAGACNYRDTGKNKNRYNMTVTYSWADTPSVSHQLRGELLARRS